MQNAEKTTEISAVAEQKMPAAGKGRENFPAAPSQTTSSVPRQDKSASITTPDTYLSGAASVSKSAPAVAAAAWPSMTQLRSLERAHDLMSLHAFRLRDSGGDALRVVIKPGPDLQLSLNLQMRDGNVEMQATLHRGDFDFMNRHWGELQHNLEQRGVRLTALGCGTQDGGHASAQSDRRKPEDNAMPAGAFAEFALNGALTPAAARKTAVPRGWETWA